MFTRKIAIQIVIITLAVLLPLSAQHRGDNLSFQGLSDFNDLGVKATAMGGAVNAKSGDIYSLFSNPAGLAGISKIQISVAGSYFNKHWRENQDYRPNRLFVTLPFYLEGLYIPDPAEDGMWDYDRMWTEDQTVDSTYFVSDPELGQDRFSKEAADWKRDVDDFGINNFAVAVPLQINDRNLVISAAYSRKINIEDYDRNDTYLDPHIGYSGYGEIVKVNGSDTIDVNWSRYERLRSGSINTITAAAAYDLDKYFNIGLGFNYNWGTSDEYQLLDRVGQFQLYDENEFMYSYQNVFSEVKGTSDFSYNEMFFGAQIEFDKFAFGVKVNLPYTITRDWKYENSYVDSISSSSTSESGSDEYEIPATFSFGLNFSPVDNFSLSLDYDYQPLSDGKITSASNDTTFTGWTDRNIIKAGLEYQPFEYLSILAGYRTIPSTFIPDGAAIKDAGPSADSYTFGVSIALPLGRLDLAYELRNMRYYDSYYSNSNYNTETFSNLLFGYTLSL